MVSKTKQPDYRFGIVSTRHSLLFHAIDRQGEGTKTVCGRRAFAQLEGDFTPEQLEGDTGCARCWQGINRIERETRMGRA